jgi:hypothetical protein
MVNLAIVICITIYSFLLDKQKDDDFGEDKGSDAYDGLSLHM